MKLKFVISEEEKKLIQKKYGLISESVEMKGKCTKGDCTNTDLSTEESDIFNFDNGNKFVGKFKDGFPLEGTYINKPNSNDLSIKNYTEKMVTGEYDKGEIILSNNYYGVNYVLVGKEIYYYVSLKEDGSMVGEGSVSFLDGNIEQSKIYGVFNQNGSNSVISIKDATREGLDDEPFDIPDLYEYYINNQLITPNISTDTKTNDDKPIKDTPTDNKTKTEVISIKGNTEFESTVKTTSNEKTFSGILPNTTIIIKKLKDIDKSVEVGRTKSDGNGNFNISNIPVGTGYTISAIYGDKPYFEYNSKQLSLTKDIDVSLILQKTNFQKRLENKVNNLINFTDSEYIKYFFSDSNKSETSTTTEKDEIFKCLEGFKKYANSIRNSESKTEEVLNSDKELLSSCWSKFKSNKKFRNKLTDSDMDLIKVPPGNLLKYQIPLKENYNKPNIYIKENNDMSDIIKNIVKEHSLKKQKPLMVESNIIKDRLNFVLNTQNQSNTKSLIKHNLTEEKKSLIKNGYNVKLVNETFVDIMNTLFASENKNILTDIKKRLGDRVATVFKFEMLKSVFDQISDNDLRTALEKKDPDLISGPIVDKIIETYKLKYPQDKILGLVFDSISKKELQKKITDLIKDDFNKTVLNMDDLVTKVRNVVSGN